MKKIIIQTFWLVVTFSIRLSSSSSMPFSCIHESSTKNWDLILDDCFSNRNTQLLKKEEMLLSKFSVIGTSLLLKLVRCNSQQPLCNCQVTNLHLEETTWNDHLKTERSWQSSKQNLPSSQGAVPSKNIYFIVFWCSSVFSLQTYNVI